VRCRPHIEPISQEEWEKLPRTDMAGSTYARELLSSAGRKGGRLNGRSPRSRIGRPPKVDWKKVVRAFRSGKVKTGAEAARKFGCSRVRINQILRRARPGPAPRQGQAGGRWFPISPLMNHAVVGKHALPGDWDFWQHYSRRLLARCDDLIVITMPGWKTSRGVQSEITLAGILSLPVHHHEQWSRQTYQAAHDRQDD
jgi:hypothetical protein